jgi:hypothetical protein
VSVAQAQNRSFTLENDRFVLDGKPIQIISGRWATWGRRRLMVSALLSLVMGC